MTAMLPKKSEFGKYVVPGAIIYPSGIDFEDVTNHRVIKMPDKGKWMLWQKELGFVMDKNGPRYFATAEKALEYQTWTP